MNEEQKNEEQIKRIGNRIKEIIEKSFEIGIESDSVVLEIEELINFDVKNIDYYKAIFNDLMSVRDAISRANYYIWQIEKTKREMKIK